LQVSHVLLPDVTTAQQCDLSLMKPSSDLD
jgi:hypothetical protein